jgi:adenylylsulfate kinase
MFAVVPSSPEALAPNLALARRKILLMGLPGAGKTTLSRIIAPKLGAVVFNADEIRANINRDLSFSLEDRIEQARRMGWLCQQVADAGYIAIADFVCPTTQTCQAFGDGFVIWVDRLKKSRFADTNRLFTPPTRYDVRIPAEDSPEDAAARMLAAYGPLPGRR